jgi:hypothetical protein
MRKSAWNTLNRRLGAPKSRSERRGVGKISLLFRETNPGRPFRSSPLYRLSYPGSSNWRIWTTKLQDVSSSYVNSSLILFYSSSSLLAGNVKLPVDVMQQNLTAWLLIIRPRLGTSGGLLWTRQWTFGFYKMFINSWVDEWLVVSLEVLFSVELVTEAASS